MSCKVSQEHWFKQVGRANPSRSSQHSPLVWSAGSSIDVSLNDKGQEQAATLAAALAEHRISEIWSSPLKRALETAVAVAAVQQRANPELSPIRVRRAILSGRSAERRLIADGVWPSTAGKEAIGITRAAGGKLGRA